MKKTISLLLSAIFTLSAITVSTVSCEKNDEPAATTAEDSPKELTPKETYLAAIQTFDQTDNYTVSYKYSLSLKGKNDPMYSPVVQENISESRKGNNVTCKMTQGNQTIELSHINGVMYMNDGNTKAKATMTWDEFVKQFEYERPEVIEQLPDSAFNQLTVISQNNGQLMRFRLSDGEIRAMAGDMREFLQLGSASDNAKFQSCTYGVYFDEDGRIYKTELEIELSVVYRDQACDGMLYIDTTIAYGMANVKAPVKTDSYVDLTGRLDILK